MKMKIAAKVIMAIALVAPFVWAGVTFAVDTTTQKPASTDGEQEQLTPEQQKELKARLDKRKADLKVKLSTAEQQKLTTRCKSSQEGAVTSLNSKIKGIENSRAAVYGGLISRLSQLSTRLQNQGIAVSELQPEIVTLRTKFDTYTADLATYKQAVSDLKAMDCTKDPTAFKASLEAARSALNKLRSDATDIRSYVTQTVKPTLTKLHGQLEGSNQ